MFESKKKFALWMYPETYEKIEILYKEDNCDSRSEFIEKAVLFYAGYLTSKDQNGYLPSVMTITSQPCGNAVGFFLKISRKIRFA